MVKGKGKGKGKGSFLKTYCSPIMSRFRCWSFMVVKREREKGKEKERKREREREREKERERGTRAIRCQNSNQGSQVARASQTARQSARKPGMRESGRSQGE